MDVGLQQPKTSQFPWVSHPDAVPVEIWETPPAVRRRRGVSHIPTGCRIQLGFYSFKCDKGGIAFRCTGSKKDFHRKPIACRTCSMLFRYEVFKLRTRF